MYRIYIYIVDGLVPDVRRDDTELGNAPFQSSGVIYPGLMKRISGVLRTRTNKKEYKKKCGKITTLSTTKYVNGK